MQMWEDLEEVATKLIDYSNNPKFKTLEKWLQEQEYTPLTELELEQKIADFFAKKYVALREVAYPNLGELPDALTKDWDNMPQEFKKLFSNLGKYLDKCKKVKKMYPKEVQST